MEEAIIQNISSEIDACEENYGFTGKSIDWERGFVEGLKFARDKVVPEAAALVQEVDD